MSTKRYVMTARRKAALRKAQLTSARKRRKGIRKAKKIEKYGASAKTANAKQRRNRVQRNINRVRVGYLAAYAVGMGAYVRQYNSKIAYNGSYTARDGRVYNQQVGPKFIRVTPTAAGVRRRNRADFRKQYGRKALRQLKRNVKRTQRERRNMVRYGSTTMSWGPRQQAALPPGRVRRQRGY